MQGGEDYQIYSGSYGYENVTQANMHEETGSQGRMTQKEIR